MENYNIDYEIDAGTRYEIRCEKLCKNYASKPVLKNVDLVLESNKIYGLIGRNGAGKTTLLSILSAQNPATSGNVTMNGEKVWENKRALNNICFSRELSPILGMNQNSMKVKEYLKIASVYYPYWDKAMADRLIKAFELDVNKRIIKLSKGMMSMVTIIVAMASKSKFTFLDEPVAGLDVIMREFFYKELIEEYNKTGRTFVISTHIIEEAQDVFEEVIMIKDGEIILKENTAELLDRIYHVSGKAEDVDSATLGLEVHHEEILGRGKGVTVVLHEGQKIREGYDISIQAVNLQNVFVALCGMGE